MQSNVLSQKESKMFRKMPPECASALALLEKGVIDPLLEDDELEPEFLPWAKCAELASDPKPAVTNSHVRDVSEHRTFDLVKQATQIPKVWCANTDAVGVGIEVVDAVDISATKFDNDLAGDELTNNFSKLGLNPPKLDNDLNDKFQNMTLHPPTLSPDDLSCSDGNNIPSPDGSIMLPDDVSSTIFRTELLPTVASPRPYLNISFYGLQTHPVLVDSGSQINTFPEDQYKLLECTFATQGFTIPKLDAIMAIRVFGGKLIPHSAVALMHLRLGNGGSLYNIPFVIIPTTPDIKTAPLIGSCFMAQTKSKLIYYEDKCEFHLGCDVTLPPIRATLVGKEQHNVISLVSVDIMPKETKDLELTFGSVPSLSTTLDDEVMMLTGVLDQLDLDQVVVPAAGTIKALATNTSEYPFTILEYTPIGSCELMSSIQESIELGPLSNYVNIVELSKQRVIHCLCTSSIGNAALLINLNKGNMSLLGTTHEFVSPFEGRVPLRSKVGSMSCRGWHIYFWANGTEKKVITQQDVDVIKTGYPVKSTHLIMPYAPGRMLDLPTMESCQLFREAGYTVSIACFIPKDANPKDKCERCVNSIPDQLMGTTDSYKISDLFLIFPNPEGTIPSLYANKLVGTESYTFKLWDWSVTYYLVHPMRIVFHVHMPPPVTMSPDTMKIYLLMLLAYLKPIYPHATVSIPVCQGILPDPNDKLKTKHQKFRL